MKPATRQFTRVSRDLERISMQFINDLEALWGKDQEVSKVLEETRQALSSIQATLDILDASISRLDELRVTERRKGFRLVKG
ncbi:MAG: hypothetical protein K9M96_07340 [Deltaproteobacteria bacterium]|nr:hypothetical protein [Deltaproteobacteria bacterium]